MNHHSTSEVIRELFLGSWFVLVGSIVSILAYLRKMYRTIHTNERNIKKLQEALKELEEMQLRFRASERELAASIAIIGARARALDDLIGALSAEGIRTMDESSTGGGKGP